MVVNLLQADRADEFVAPGSVGAPGPARCLLTVEVADVAAVPGEPADFGVALRNGPQDRPWGVRTAAFADPAGHLGESAAPLPDWWPTTGASPVGPGRALNPSPVQGTTSLNPSPVQGHVVP